MTIEIYYANWRDRKILYSGGSFFEGKTFFPFRPFFPFFPLSFLSEGLLFALCEFVLVCWPPAYKSYQRARARGVSAS